MSESSSDLLAFLWMRLTTSVNCWAGSWSDRKVFSFVTMPNGALESELFTLVFSNFGGNHASHFFVRRAFCL